MTASEAQSKMKLHETWNRRDGWYELTPAIAQGLLETASANRPLREARAARIAADITRNAWRVNGETIVFDERGRLLDGQHRLRACVLAQKPIVCYCIFGIPARLFSSFDQGMARNGFDIAALMEFPNAALVAATARLAIAYADGTLKGGFSGKLPNDQLRLYLERHRDALTGAGRMAVQHAKNLAHLMPTSHAAFMVYMTFEKEPARTAEFLEKVATGVGLHKGEPILVFRQRMIDLNASSATLPAHHRLAMLIKTWNAFRAKRQVLLLRFIDGEAYPQVEM